MTITFTRIDDAKDVTFNQLLGINNEGEIAGYFGANLTPADPNKGYTVTLHNGQPHFTDENFLGSVQTQVTGINNSGLTVGFWVDGNGDNYGFVDNNGQYITAIDPLAPQPTATAPVTEQFLGVNDHDMAVGFYNDAQGNSHGFTYDIKTGAFSAVNVGGFSSLTAAAINNNGDIAGFGMKGGVDEAFLKVGNKVTLLTGPSGASNVQALGVNNEDDVVGSYQDSTGATHGFLYDAQTKSYTTIDDTSNATKGSKALTVINGINDKGQLVGFYLNGQGHTDGLLITISGSASSGALSMSTTKVS